MVRDASKGNRAFHHPIAEDGVGAGQGSLAFDFATLTGIALPRFPHWPAERLAVAEYVAFYPNVLLGLQADHGGTVGWVTSGGYAHHRAASIAAGYAPAPLGEAPEFEIEILGPLCAARRLARPRLDPAGTRMRSRRRTPIRRRAWWSRGDCARSHERRRTGATPRRSA